jgi:serine protease
MKRLSFSKFILTFTIFILFVFVAGFSVDAINAENTNKPPFFAGQVVIRGAPESIPNEYSVIKYLPNANLTVVAVEKGKERGHIQSLTARGFRANLNLRAEAFVTAVNDQHYNLQWHLPLVQSDQAWDLNDGFGVTVAVLDTGLRLGGSDGIGCVVSGIDTVNGDNDPTDGYGHGTHVSGTIAQRTNNSIGVVGLAYGACIMPVKVLNDSGSGSFADIAEGIYYAVNNGAKVINMSLGTNARFNLRSDMVMDPALDYAYNNGVTVVCASGNDGSRKNVSYPAIYPTSIAVGAIDLRSQVMRYSNRGEGLDMVAPGGDTGADRNGDGYADGVLQETYGNNGWAYYFKQGTSMASPHVAAAAAMLYSYGVVTNADDAYQVLTSTAQDLGDAGFDNTSGYGLVQAYDALTYDPTDSCTDADGDGWCVEDGDCDDTDPDVYPGHSDKRGRWGKDGFDNDCNGIIDG